MSVATEVPAEPDINGGIEPCNAPSVEAARALVDSFPYWYHRIYLGNGVYTVDAPTSFPEAVWQLAKGVVPHDLEGASVLDVGCNAGYFSLQMKLRGAGRVLGLEVLDLYHRQAELVREIWDIDIEYRHGDAHQLGAVDERFDLVVFCGVLYHLKNPLQALEGVGRICRDAVLIETEVIPEQPESVVHARQGPPGAPTTTACRGGFMKFVEADELNGDGSNWWIPDAECVRGMLRTAGFRCFSEPLYYTEGRMLLAASRSDQSLLRLDGLGSPD